MAWTQADIDALKDALKRGVRSYSIHGRQVSYHSVAEMQSLLAQMEAEVNPSKRRTTVAVFRRS